MKWTYGGTGRPPRHNYDRIRKLLEEGLEPAVIATRMGCSRQVVHTVRKKMEKENGKST